MDTTEKTIILQPITRSFSENIHILSRLRPPVKVTMQEFLTYYTDHPRLIKVDFAPGNCPTVTAYGFGRDCWYIKKIEGDL